MVSGSVGPYMADRFTCRGAAICLEFGAEAIIAGNRYVARANSTLPIAAVGTAKRVFAGGLVGNEATTA
jgi:hypothetical protein